MQRQAQDTAGRQVHHVDVALVEQHDLLFCIEHAEALQHVVERRIELQLLFAELPLGLLLRLQQALPIRVVLVLTHVTTFAPAQAMPTRRFNCGDPRQGGAPV